MSATKTSPSLKEQLHRSIIKNLKTIDRWYFEKSKGLRLSLYASFDIRDSGEKIAPVDANAFPAGFNNICQTDQESAPEKIKAYLKHHLRYRVHQVGLVAEHHTSNPYYWDNIFTLKQLFEMAGLDVYVLLAEKHEETKIFDSASGQKIIVNPVEIQSGLVKVKGKELDLIVSNNDFSQGTGDWIELVDTPKIPSPNMGWWSRRKVDFFKIYNELVAEFSDLVAISPARLQIATERFSPFDIAEQASLEALKEKTETFFHHLKSQYKREGILETPYAFIKNSKGTYGLGVIEVSKPEDILSWNYKSRKKMKASKGGGGFQEVIIQEGIPTIIKDGDRVAEPTVYMVGPDLVGGFLRSNKRKGERENLNSPGVVFQKLCVTDLEIDMHGKPLENVYGWLSKIGMLALGLEEIKNSENFNSSK